MYGLTIFGWDTTIWKSGIWGCKKNLNIEKITFKVVQMKFLAMHITNQKLSFDIFTVGNLQNIFMEHDLYLILLCRLARGEMAPRLSLVSPKVFFSVLSPMEFWFLAAVASGLLSWGHLISSDIVDLIEQKLFELNWAGRCHHWIQ